MNSHFLSTTFAVVFFYPVGVLLRVVVSFFFSFFYYSMMSAAVSPRLSIFGFEQLRRQRKAFVWSVCFLVLTPCKSMVVFSFSSLFNRHACLPPRNGLSFCQEG